MQPTIAAIAAIGKDRVLGKENKLLWHIPDDLKRFKELTLGHPVIMGRKTFESILNYTNGKPLPERANIVVTRSARYGAANPMLHLAAYQSPGVIAAESVEDAIEKARAIDPQEVFVIGGAQIYAAALPHVTKLYLTLIDDKKEGDTFFPPYEHDFTRVTFEQEREWKGLRYKWVDLER